MNLSELTTTLLPAANITVNEYQSATALEYYALSSYFIFATAVGVILNLLTIFVVGCGSHLYKGMKIQLINLALTDLVLAAIYPLLNYFLFVELSFPGDLALCGIIRFVSIMSLHATLLCNTVMSLEMLVMIYLPARAARYTKVQKLVVVGAIWLCSIVPEIANTIGLQYVRYDGVEFCEGILYREHGSDYGWLQMGRNIVSGIIIFVAYAIVLAKVCRKKERESTSLSKDCEDIRKLILMLAVDAFLTMLTTNANAVHWSLETADEAARERYDLDVIFAVIVSSNAFTTPLVYLACSKGFRMDARQLYHKIACRNSYGLQRTDQEDPDQPLLELTDKFEGYEDDVVTQQT